MGVVLAFLAGWAVGAKAGAAGFDEVRDAAKTVKESPEFEALLAITRTHVAQVLQELGKLLSGETPAPTSGDLLERVQRLTDSRPSS